MDNEIKLHIHCHTDNRKEIEAIEEYWIAKLQLTSNSVRKGRIKEGGNVRTNRLEYGLCTPRIHRTDLLHHIYGAIQEYGGFDNPEWLF